jgi:hypothetical protein
MNDLIYWDITRKASQVKVKAIKKRERSFWNYHIDLYSLVDQLYLFM